MFGRKYKRNSSLNQLERKTQLNMGDNIVQVVKFVTIIGLETKVYEIIEYPQNAEDLLKNPIAQPENNDKKRENAKDLPPNTIPQQEDDDKKYSNPDDFLATTIAQLEDNEKKYLAFIELFCCSKSINKHDFINKLVCVFQKGRTLFIANLSRSIQIVLTEYIKDAKKDAKLDKAKIAENLQDFIGLCKDLPVALDTKIEEFLDFLKRLQKNRSPDKEQEQRIDNNREAPLSVYFNSDYSFDPLILVDATAVTFDTPVTVPPSFGNRILLAMLAETDENQVVMENGIDYHVPTLQSKLNEINEQPTLETNINSIIESLGKVRKEYTEKYEKAVDMSKLTQYIEDRNKEREKDKSEYHRFWGRLFSYSATVKISAAQKIIDLINKKEVKAFTHEELGALRDGDLGRIMAEIKHLPKKFITAEQELEKTREIMAWRASK